MKPTFSPRCTVQPGIWADFEIWAFSSRPLRDHLMTSIKVSLSSDGQQGIKIAVTPYLVEQTAALLYFGCCWLFLVGYFDALRDSDLPKGMIWGTEFLVKEEFLATSQKACGELTRTPPAHMPPRLHFTVTGGARGPAEQSSLVGPGERKSAESIPNTPLDEKERNSASVASPCVTTGSFPAQHPFDGPRSSA